MVEVQPGPWRLQLSCVCLADPVLSRWWDGRVGWGWRPAAHRLEDGEKKEAPHGDPSLTCVPPSKPVWFPFAGLSPHKAHWLWSHCRLDLASDLTQQTFKGPYSWIPFTGTWSSISAAAGAELSHWEILFPLFLCRYPLVSGHCWLGVVATR